MGLERPNVSSTLLVIKQGGGYQLSGLVRQTDSDGTTTIRAANQNLTDVWFNDIEFIDPPSSGGDGDIALTHYSNNRSVGVTGT